MTETSTVALKYGLIAHYITHAQMARQHAPPPGAPTTYTPGYTDRVHRILAKVRTAQVPEEQHA